MKPRCMKTFSVSSLVRAGACPHAFALDCFEDRNKGRRESDAERRASREGLFFESRVLRDLGFDEADAKPLEPGEAFSRTVEAMRLGRPWVAQPYLMREGVAGIPDLLRRVKTPSKLGRFSYEPVDIKNRKNTTLNDRMQLAAYAYLLEELLGKRPAQGGIWLSDGSIRILRLTGKRERYFDEVLTTARLIREGVLTTQPVRCASCRTCNWLPECSRVWENSGHVSLLSGVGKTLADKLEGEGLGFCADLALADPALLVRELALDPFRARRLVLAARARHGNEAIVLKQPVFPEGRPVYFYDIETWEDRVFLHGLIRSADGRREEYTFFAEGPDGEGRIWHEMLDLLGRDEGAVVYCWTWYERVFAEKLWERYGGNENGYELLKQGLTDQCAFVRDHFVLPCRGYSIKSVAPFFGFRWQTPDANGMNCVAWYGEWLEEGNPEVRKRMIEYNLDDVRAMVVIDDELRRLVAEGGKHGAS